MATTTAENSSYSVEVHFAQRLAANEKKIRDRAVKRLRQWIAARSQKETVLGEDELMRLWKGLFYCMWMCDKPVIQEELADQISDMMHCFRKPGQGVMFFDTYLLTMKREWIGIDHLRMDKYLMLVRRIFRQTLVLLHNNEWEEELLELFLNALRRSTLNPDVAACPDGLRYQIANVYLDELAREGAEELTPQQASSFLVPFAELAAKTLNKQLRDVMLEDIFQDVVERSNVGEEQEDEEDEGIASDEDGKKKSPKKNKKTSKKRRKDNLDEEDDEEEEEEVEDDADILEKVMFPEEMVPPLEYDYGFLADKLFELASDKNIPPRNRKPLYTMVQRFKSLSKGAYPMPDIVEEIRNDPDTDYLKDELPWWKKLQAKDKQKKKRRKRRRGKKGAKGGDDGEGGDGVNEEEVEDEGVEKKRRKVEEVSEEASDVNAEKKKKRKKKKGNGNADEEAVEVQESDSGLDRDSTNIEESENDSIPQVKSKVKKSKAKKSKVKEAAAEEAERMEVNTADGGDSQGAQALSVENEADSQNSSGVEGLKKRKKKNKKGQKSSQESQESESSIVGHTEQDDPNQGAGDSVTTSAKRDDGQVAQATSIEGSIEDLTPRTKAKKSKKRKTTTPAKSDSDVPESAEGSPTLEISAVAGNDRKGSNVNEISPTPDTGAEKPFAAFQTVETPPPAYVKKSKAKTAEVPSTLPRAKAKSHFDAQYTPPMTRKRVKIALSKNEFNPDNDYRQRVKLSPGVPFDGSKKPAHSVLKTPQKSEAIKPKVKGSAKWSAKAKKRRSRAVDFF